MQGGGPSRTQLPEEEKYLGWQVTGKQYLNGIYGKPMLETSIFDGFISYGGYSLPWLVGIT